MYRFLAYVLSMGFLFLAGASWLSPKLLSWYASPAVPLEINCVASITWALQKLVVSQFVGFSIGAVVGLILLILRRKPKAIPTTVDSGPGVNSAP